MKKAIYQFIILCLFTLSSCSHCKINADEDYTQFVNPFIGTSGFGHTFPGATVPLGLVQLGPQTGNFVWDYCAGYQYNDTKVWGYSHTRLNGTGIGDLGDILTLPFVETRALEQRGVSFAKDKEVASPGFYATVLEQDEIGVELTATEHVGVHRYTYAKGGKGHVLFDIDNTLFSWGDSTESRVYDSQLNLEDETTISGAYKSRFWVDRQLYFVIEISKPMSNYSFVENTQNRQLILDFDLKKGESIEIRTGLSTVSIDGAKNNLKTEVDNMTFEQITKQAKRKWNNYLSKIKIEASPDEKTNFYTSLYHLFIQPNNIADVDGQYRGADDKVYHSSSKAYYSTLSLWDTFRAAHPLYTILTPDKNGDFISSMLEHYKVRGYLPIWTLWGKENHTMIGNHAIPVIADAYLKGISNFDEDLAYEAVKNSLTKTHWGKYKWDIYDKYGYLPSDIVKSESVSRLLEGSFDDWCAAQMAQKMGKMADYDFFSKRSNYYKNVFDPSCKLMRPKNADGSWGTPFDPIKIAHAGSGDGPYTEGNAWQYSWHVLQDVDGLVKLMGGKKEFGLMLDTLFSMPPEVYGDGLVVDISGLIGQYAHGNEPSHHVIYLYNDAGEPHKAQKLIREVLSTQYINRPDGLSGNDDCGQMSAWYIFSSLGFYPVNPASGVFYIGTPLFKEAKINVGNNGFEIKAPGVSEENIYVKSVTLNGRPIESLKITYDQIMSGGVLEFEMTNTSN